MKKSFFLAMLSAIVLTGAMTFTACSSSEDAVEPNPTYDGTAVRTDFAFSITKAAQTRMSAANVQEGTGASFLGMKDMYLLPFKGKPGEVATTNSANFPLGELTTSDITSTPSDRTSSVSSKVYSLTLPIETSDFLFYGTAINSATYAERGQITSTLSNTITNINDISFSLNSIAGSLTDRTKIATYLTNIAKTSYTYTPDGGSETTTITWAQTVNLSTIDGTYRSLADLYTKFTSNAAPRAGSAEAVVRTVLDLFKSAAAINEQSSVSVIKGLARAICTSIDTETSDGVRVTVAASNADPDKWTAAIKGMPADWPANLGLPMGAAQLKWDGTQFFYKDALYSLGSTDNFSVEKYRYPSELIYFDNSPLRATDQYKKVSDYPISASLWDAALGTANGFSSDWSGTKVLPSTRAVAMQNNINYGVALLVSTVKLGPDDGLLTDNMSNVLPGATENQVNIDGTKFTLTGILVGGQPASVKWNMINAEDEFNEVIYDKDIPFTTALTTSASNPNYTIVLDNYATPSTDNKQKNVLIALELKNGDATGNNKGMDFYGKDGMIPAGSTFYLVGELALDYAYNWQGKVDAVNRPDSYRITNERTYRVFVQDYKTIANFNIKKDALQKAYSTVPDLRSTEVVFGLSVDLKWEEGITFNVDIK